MAIDRGKYVVIKREDLDAMYNGRESYKREVLAKALDGCVVIRLQDVFAAPALHSYAAAMGVATLSSETSGERRRNVLECGVLLDATDRRSHGRSARTNRRDRFN